MKRKIIKQGHNTLTVTLPSKWVKDLNLSAGDEIELIEKDKSILITSEKHNGEIKSIAFVPGKREFYASSGDGKLIKWNLDNWKVHINL